MDGKGIFLDDLHVSLDITSRSLDECGSGGSIWLDDNLISDVVRKHVVIFCECVDSVKVQIQEVCSPRRGIAVNGTVHGQGKINAEMEDR